MIPKSNGNNPTVFYITGTVLVVLLIVGTLLTSYFIMQERKIADRIYPNVYIDDYHLGDLTRAEAQKLFVQKNEELKKIKVTVLFKEEAIATISGEKNKIHLDNNEIIDRAYLIGRTPHTPSRILQKISSIFKLQDFRFMTAVNYDMASIKELLSQWEEGYNKPAKNALFNFAEGKVTTFRQHEDGKKIESEKFLSDLNILLQQYKNTNKNTGSISLAISVIKPEVTLSQANNFGIEELIGEGVSDYTHSIPERIYNLNLAASKFNGVLIPKGKEISFNEIVGDISSSTGYKPAYVIQNGRTVLGDGGGICQASTTLFRAALNTGLPIPERTAHAYRVQYYENDAKPGLDATVFGPTVDLKITNDTPAAILIQTEADLDNNLLYFRFYGKRDGRTAEMSDIRLYDPAPAPEPLYEDDFTLKKGVVKQVDFAASGIKSQFMYKIHYADNKTYEKNFLSVYRPWKAIYLVGQAD